MLGDVGDGAGGAATWDRRLATPAEVASYLQVPVKTLSPGATRGQVLARTVFDATCETARRTWRLGSLRLRRRANGAEVAHRSAYRHGARLVTPGCRLPARLGEHVISGEALTEAISLGRIDDDELLGLLAELFPLSRWSDGRRVTFFHPQQGHVLDAVYDRHGRIAACEPQAGLTSELQGLRDRVTDAVNALRAWEVRRDPLFSTPAVGGFWRHDDEWQILPAPPEAPRLGFLLGGHPFIFEYRVPTSASTRAALTRRSRRLWQLHLLFCPCSCADPSRRSRWKPHITGSCWASSVGG